MSAGTSQLFCLIACFLVCSSEAQTNITAKLGQDVTLPCKAPNIIIIAVEWSRPGLDPDHVLVYRDGHLDVDNQHPSYKNRVDLQDKEMKDGDVSLILKDVMKNDTGTYECRVKPKGMTKPISIIKLEVHLSGDKVEIIGDGGDKNGGDKDGGNMVGNIVGPVVGVILLLAVASVGFWLCRRYMRQNGPLPVPPDEAVADQTL